MQNPFEDVAAPVFRFPPPPPPPRSTTAEGPARPEPVQSFGRSGILIIVVVVLVLGGVVALAIIGSVSNNAPQQASTSQPQTSAQISTSRGQIQTVCLRSLQGYATCWALDLPANGEWIRWLSPTTAPTTITGASGVVARGCKGEIYDLGKGGQSFNGSCGYLDYHATDGKVHTVYIGVK